MDKTSPCGIPYVDWGGQGPVLHFAHANGFPPGTYGAFVALLTDQLRVLGMECRALWRAQPVAGECGSPGERAQPSQSAGGMAYPPERFRHWREMADDLARFLSDLQLNNIVGAGHSLGAVTTLYCAAANPRLFRALILIDPVIIPAYLVPAVALAQRLNVASRAALPSGARRRRMEWPDRESLFRAYRAAPVFARWKEQFLRDYITSGTTESPTGSVRLRYPRDWEARIFETVPADVWFAIPRLRHIPLLVLRGEHSGTYRRDTMRMMRWLLPRGEFQEIEGADHFVPMSRPQETALAIRSFLERLPEPVNSSS